MDTIGTLLRLSIFGESHSPAIGAVLDGIAPGTPIDESFIAEMLTRRRPCGAGDTARVESDEFTILSGVCNGIATGSPISIIIPNTNIRPQDYSSSDGSQLARPSHADYSAQAKFHGFQARSGGGHFSGRITAAIVAVGAICTQALEAKGVKIGTHILNIAGIKDISWDNSAECLRVAQQYAGDSGTVAAELDKDSATSAIDTLIAALRAKSFPVSDEVEEQMQAEILAARAQGDSVGGIVQTAVTGLPAGIGEPLFDSLEGAIARAVFAIGGIKGIEFGSGFELAKMRGSQANDPFRMDGDRVVTSTNHSGGINGGISNGMPLIFNMVVRPTPSIAQPQQTVDLKTMQDATIEVRGRHDPAIVRRICVVISSMVAIVLYDMIARHFGKDWLV